MGTAETGGMRCLSSHSSGCFVHLLFLIVCVCVCVCVCELGRCIFSEVNSGLKLDLSKASVLLSLSLNFSICKMGGGRLELCFLEPQAASEMSQGFLD